MEGAKSHHEMFRRLQEQLAEISDVEFKDIPLGSGDNNDWSNILIWYLTYDHPEYFDDPLARMARGVPFLSEDFPKYYTMLLIQLEMTDLDNAMQHLERSLARFEYKLHKLEVEQFKQLSISSDFMERFQRSQREQNTDTKVANLANKLKTYNPSNNPFATVKAKAPNPFKNNTEFDAIKTFLDELVNAPGDLIDYGVVKSSEYEKKRTVEKTWLIAVSTLLKFTSSNGATFVFEKISDKIKKLTSKGSSLKQTNQNDNLSEIREEDDEDKTQGEIFSAILLNAIKTAAEKTNEIVEFLNGFENDTPSHPPEEFRELDIQSQIKGTDKLVNFLATLIDSYTLSK